MKKSFVFWSILAIVILLSALFLSGCKGVTTQSGHQEQKVEPISDTPPALPADDSATGSESSDGLPPLPD
jgi:hypothetical protein